MRYVSGKMHLERVGEISPGIASSLKDCKGSPDLSFLSRERPKKHLFRPLGASALKQPPRQRRSPQYARHHVDRRGEHQILHGYQLARAEARDGALDRSAPRGYQGCERLRRCGDAKEFTDDDLAKHVPKRAMGALGPRCRAKRPHERRPGRRRRRGAFE